MVEKKSFGNFSFSAVNSFLLILLTLAFLYPMWYVFVGSFSDPYQMFVNTDLMILPKGFSLIGYQQVFRNRNILIGYGNTLFYLVLGTVSNVLITSLGAYVLSRPQLALKRFFSLMVVFTMYFSGGLIPSFLIVKGLGLYDSRFAIILPTLVGTYNMIVMRTSFKALPASIEESARIDGANDFTILFRIVIPCAKATLAVITLFYAVSYWNNWFNAMVYLKSRKKFPLQLFLREILLANSANGTSAAENEQSEMMYIEDVMRYATIIISTLPILCVYPFCQRYFLKGVMMGSVKE